MAWCSEAKEIWSLPYAGEMPVAAFFDASSGAIYVSVKEGERARLDRVSFAGKLEKKGVATGKGEPGPLRAFDGKLYWIVGSSVQIVDPKGARGTVSHIPADKGIPTDIAVARDGSVFLAFSAGALFRVSEKGALLIREGKPISGLLLLQEHLHLLSAGMLETLNLDKKEESSENFCECTGLERSSRSTWISTQKGKVLEGRQTILTLKAETGRLAYVYRMDTAEDFFVLPFPKEGIVRAYRMPGAVKKRGADK